MTCLVSVIMPVKNAGEFLSPAVHSILEQSHRKLELILVDDHSSDAAIDALPDDPRLHVLASKGEGVVAAFNTGLANVRGEFVARMDADDIALPERIELQLNLLLGDPDIGIAGIELYATAGDGNAFIMAVKGGRCHGAETDRPRHRVVKRHGPLGAGLGFGEFIV